MRFAAIFVFVCKLLCGCVLLSCVGGSKRDVAVVGDTLPMLHSSLLHIVECDSFSVAEIKNPWRGGLMHRYLLVPRDSAVPCNMPEGTILRTPLSNMLLFSTVHTCLYNTLGQIDAVGGVCDAKYMLLPSVHEKISSGSVVDCGSTMNVDVERVVQLSPDAVFVLPFENGGYGKIEKLPYSIVECAEYMETSPLGAAEWMRFYGRLTGCAGKADSLFFAVCDTFAALRARVDTVSRRPSLMCELKSNSAWYMPAGCSTMGQLYAMAGARYIFGYNEGSGSVPLSYETVLDRASEADVWLFKYNSSVDKTYSSLLDDFRGYSHFKPFKERNVYACNTARRPFYDETPFRPDILLRELIAIFHPSLVGDYKLRYYEKIQE